MKNIKILILSLFICISFSLPVFATSSKPLVIDSANIISSNTEASLIKKAKEIQKKYNINVVIARARPAPTASRPRACCC